MDHVNATPLVPVATPRPRRCAALAGVLLASLLTFGCGFDSLSSGGGSPPPTGGQPGQAPLNISGSPPTEAPVGEAYSFTPQVSGGQGSRSFSAQNMPPWANFDSSTGRVSGTPGNSNMATYGGIRITVRDTAGSSATLGPFEVEVVAPGTANVTLSWQAPTERADGTPLSDLAGFRIFYGRSRDNLDTTVDLSNPGLSRYVVENLRRGNWYFAMTAYDQAGLQSSRSPTVEARL